MLEKIKLIAQHLSQQTRIVKIGQIYLLICVNSPTAHHRFERNIALNVGLLSMHGRRKGVWNIHFTTNSHKTLTIANIRQHAIATYIGIMHGGIYERC